jgi:hypothetical protein
VRQASFGYEIAKGDAESRRKVYDVVAETMQRLSMGAQLISMNNNVSILDRAVEPRRPVKPRAVLSIAMGCLLGLMFGVGSVLAINYFDNTIRTPEDVEQYLGLSILGIVPRYRETDSVPAREAYQSLRTSILFSSHNRERRIPPVHQRRTSGREIEHGGPGLPCPGLCRRQGRGHRLRSAAAYPAPSHAAVARAGVDQLFAGGGGRGLRALPACHGHAHPQGLHLRPHPSQPARADRAGEVPQPAGRPQAPLRLDRGGQPPIASLADSVVLASMAEMMAVVIKHNQTTASSSAAD